MPVSIAPETSISAPLTASWRDVLEDQGQRVKCAKARRGWETETSRVLAAMVGVGVGGA